MAKRFTDSEKFRDQWFRTLSLKHKCLWQYLWDGCDYVGLWKVDYAQASFLIGTEVSNNDLEAINNGKVRVVQLAPDILVIPEFAEFQYGDKLKNPKSDLHKKIVRLLHKAETQYGKLFFNPDVTLQEEEKDKDSDKDKAVVEAKDIAKAEDMGIAKDKDSYSSLESSLNGFTNRLDQNSVVHENIQPLTGDWYKHETKT
jgi:hypothetical protein